MLDKDIIEALTFRIDAGEVAAEHVALIGLDIKILPFEPALNEVSCEEGTGALILVWAAKLGRVDAMESETLMRLEAEADVDIAVDSVAVDDAVERTTECIELHEIPPNKKRPAVVRIVKRRGGFMYTHCKGSGIKREVFK